jgi:hypothetical protein
VGAFDDDGDRNLWLEGKTVVGSLILQILQSIEKYEIKQVLGVRPHSVNELAYFVTLIEISIHFLFFVDMTLG